MKAYFDGPVEGDEPGLGVGLGEVNWYLKDMTPEVSRLLKTFWGF